MMTDTTEQPPAFQQSEVVVADEAAAKAEAQRRRLLEPDPEAIEWIYLRNADKQWVARRVLRHGEPPSPPAKTSWMRRVGDLVVDVLTYS